MGQCFECGGDFSFTVNEGSIAKYLEPSLELAKKYGVSKYLCQVLELLKENVETIFAKKLEKQGGLSDWA
jgi:DNA polymerase II large subunit